MITTLRSLSADTKILFTSLILILVLSIFTVLSASAPDAPALSVRSDKADGAMAMQRWLQRSGYHVQEILSLNKQLPDLDVLFVLEPIVRFSEGDIRLIRDWVREGHTLIVSGSPFIVNDLLEPYALSLNYRMLETEKLAAAAPILLNPVFDSAALEAAYPITTERAEAVPQLFIANLPVLMSLQEENGQVWLSGAPQSFTNRGIHDGGNASIIANILAQLPPNVSIGFDEAAHGYGDDTDLDFNDWLFSTPPGWGILLGVAITMLYLALRGRRFGHPVPLPDDRLRRESGEYIQAMATLFRRTGQRSEMLKHYESQLRRRLSERYALDPNLGNDDLVKTVIYHDPSIEESAFRNLMARLRHTNISEAELVKTVTDVDLFLKQIQ